MQSKPEMNSLKSSDLNIDRRDFLKLSAISTGVPVAVGAMGALKSVLATATSNPKCATKKPPTVKVAYLWKTKGPVGADGWPGHGFNYYTACEDYSKKLQKMGEDLGLEIQIEKPYTRITDEMQVDSFINVVKAQKPDALLISPIGVGRPWIWAWRIIKSTQVPTLLYSTIGASFSMNTTPLASKQGVHLVLSLDINDLRKGLELVKTAKNLKQSTLLVIKKIDRPTELVYENIGTKLKYLPHQVYIDAYEKMNTTDEVKHLAETAISQAKEVREVKKDDIVKAAKHYFVTKKLIAEYDADGITTQCLRLMRKVGVPCLGFSALMDEGIVASCEADIGSAITMLLGHNLLRKPGFMADPLVDTTKKLFVNAHCNCPTKLEGFDSTGREPYVIRAHHCGGNLVAMQVIWRIGQIFTLARFHRPNLLIVDRAKVVCNYESPPSTACITNVGSVVEGAEDNPHKVGGFHLLQFYGDHVEKLWAYCQLYGIEAVHSWDPKVSFSFEPGYPDFTDSGIRQPKYD